MVALEDVAAYAESLPDVTLGDRYGGKKAWYVGKGKKPKSFVWERPFTKADLKRFGDADIPQGEIVGIAVADLDEKEIVLAAGIPGVFTMQHVDGYPPVLLELRKVRNKNLEQLLEDAGAAPAPAPSQPN